MKRTAPLVALAAGLLGACAAAPPEMTASAVLYLHDAAFPAAESVVIESAEQVFALDDAAREYLDRRILPIRDMEVRGRVLLDELFDEASLDVAYRNNANTVAAQTFHDRSANCLSLSILAYAMAEYAGFEATFQEVDIPEYWERRDGFSLMNQHINVRITPPTPRNAIVVRRFELEVDFRPLASLPNPPSRAIPKARALAMFYNNKGIDALLDGRHHVAYAYLRAALKQDASLDMALSNLALLYARNGFTEWAEEAYREAVRINPDNVVATENLATLLESTNRVAEARALLIELKRRRENNPYFFYIRGEEALDAGRLWDAVRLFEHAIEIRPHVDQFHFGLARAYAALGNAHRARHHLKRAERLAGYEDLKERYRDKLSALSSL